MSILRVAVRGFISVGLIVAAGLLGCSGEEPGCPRSSEPTCIACCTDQGTAAVCADGKWSCPSPFVDAQTCTQDCRPTARSSAQLCVDRDAGTCLGCPSGEWCRTTFTCVEGSDGGTACSDVDAGDEAGLFDDRCYRSCDFFNRCAAGETCIQARAASCEGAGGPGRTGLCVPVD